MAVALACSISAEAFEIRDVTMVPFPSTTSTIETRLVKPSPSEFAISRVPSVVHSDRPLEVELIVVGLSAGANAAESLASWISSHAVLQISIAVPGQPRAEVSLLVKARPSGDGWIARALARPAAWADAASVTIVSLSLAGRSLPCDCLPATLRVGYNHAPAPAGAVLAAARAGDVPALQAALDAGGSTEEVDEVRFVDVWTREKIVEGPTSFPAILQNGFSALYYAASGRRLEALSTLLAAGANPAAASKVRGEKGASYALSGRL